jgi:hypothetical protein
MFLTSFGLMRLAVYPILILYFLPPPILHEQLKRLFDKWDDYLNRIPPDEFEELDELDETDST